MVLNCFFHQTFNRYFSNIGNKGKKFRKIWPLKVYSNLNKTLCFVPLVRFIFTLQNSRSRKTLENSHTIKISSHPKNRHLILAHVHSIFGIAREYYTNTGGVGENSLTRQRIEECFSKFSQQQ